MLLRILILLTIVLCLSDTAVHAADELPRFVSLRSDEVNVRAGPGKRYAIQWVYHREGFPVEIVQEFDHWRKIRDAEGSIGWIHKHMLSGTRMALVMEEARALRRSPDAEAAALLMAEPGVVGTVMECEADWCRLQVESRKGWMRKAHLWGVYDEEEF